MGEKGFARDPLLYIDQPFIKLPQAPMQHSYTSPKKTNETIQTVQEINRAPKQRKYINRLQDLESMDTTADEEVIAGEKLVDDPDMELGEQRQKFKDMTIKERIEYFADMPDYLPKMKCEVKANKNQYRGIIVEFKDDQVKMRTGRRNITIGLDEIEQVRMLGF